MKHLLTLVLLLPALALGQATSDVILVLDFENVVSYILDPAESPMWMSSSARGPSLPSAYVYPLKNAFYVGDLAAVNGKPAKGMLAIWALCTFFSSSATPTPKRPVADVERTHIGQVMIQADDVEKGQVGTLAATLYGYGPRPRGAAPGTVTSNFTITGGTGAWSGVRGQGATIAGALPYVSAVEDPAYRRVNGGGTWRLAFTLNSVAVPTVMAAYHADFTPVSATSPAHAGETLVLEVKGLGPTSPVLVPGKTFDSGTLAAVTSPVSATMNDLPAPVLNAVGWPGTRDTYRVDIVLPSGTAPGTGSGTITVAWMQGPEFKIPVK